MGPNEQTYRDQVRTFFGDTQVYLRGNFITGIRREALLAWTRDMRFSNVIDVACGDGSIGLSLLDRVKHLTLLDITPGMTAQAAGNIPEGKRDDVTVITADFLEEDLPSAVYDLVICTGLLAHSTDPEAVVEKLATLCRPDGLVLLQNTDSRHFYSSIVKRWQGLVRLWRPSSYRFREIPAATLRIWAEKGGLEPVQRYRSMVSFMCLSHILSGKMKYRIVRILFGKTTSPRCQWAGNDEIILFRKRGGDG